MPVLPPIPGVAKIIVKQTLGGVNVFNVLHARSDLGQGWSGTELANMAAAVRAAWVVNVTPLQDADLTLNEVTVIDLSSNTGQEGSSPGSTAGTAAGTSIGANSAVCWSWKIPLRYRGGHPRTYIAGVNTNHLASPNTLLAATVTSHTNAATAIKNAVNGVLVGGANAALVCPHYVRGGIRLSSPDYSWITGVTVDTRLDSQRRRLGRDR
jgi:hypothetical protein